MTYVLLVYDRPDSLAHLSTEDQQAVYREYEALGAVPGLSGYRLRPTDRATTLRMHDDARDLREEPFAADGPVLAGFYLLETDDRDAALEVAARIPAARLGGSIELRPLAGES
jgi:hypothetical protein